MSYLIRFKDEALRELAEHGICDAQAEIDRRKQARYEIESRLVYIFPNSTKNQHYVEEIATGIIIFTADSRAECVCHVDSIFNREDRKHA